MTLEDAWAEVEREFEDALDSARAGGNPRIDTAVRRLMLVVYEEASGLCGRDYSCADYSGESHWDTLKTRIEALGA